MSPQEFYQKNIIQYTKQLKQIKQRRNLITLGKLFTFVSAVIQIYWIITTHSLALIFPIGAISLFIFLTFLDNRIVRKLQLTEQLIRINQQETEYLEGKLDSFPKGLEYLNPQHPYAVDLDLFGEDSLFQHLNRTVTTEGTHLLANWLLHLTQIPDIILQRQQAVEELTMRTKWCQQFRAAGQFQPAQKIDHTILYQWQKEPSFFVHFQRTRLLIYLFNSVTIISWIVVAFQLLPWSTGLVISLLQLILLTLFLKKINAYHRKLDRFLGTISHYATLVRFIDQQKFTSSYLSTLKNTLSSPKHNAPQALAILNKIQEGLDQRGNILTAFVLNGLYLRDLHLILRLDRWKSKYGNYINKWITAISEMDSLISMANYRFNHPTYTKPEISKTSLLNAREAGHPLLKGKHKVTNDFSIASLHQLFIVTGANMAGKSTFLRTIGINLVLAQSGNVVFSSHFSFQPMALFTSMRTTDNLAKNTSYFHAELLRLKLLTETAKKEERTFIILDEMLKGTNSTDKLNGSLAFLRKLLSYPVSGLIATHDLALGELALSHPSNFQNVCFEITHQDGNIVYDYKLHPGITTNMNATILLKQMGLI
ncbi:MAG: DNA mismatch repair protein MutS [Odoribacter sp.]